MTRQRQRPIQSLGGRPRRSKPNPGLGEDKNPGQTVPSDEKEDKPFED